MIHKFVFRLVAELVLLTMTLVYLLVVVAAIVVAAIVVAPVFLLGMWIHDLMFRKDRNILDEFIDGMQRKQIKESNCCDECRLKNVRHEEER
jgi:hypothetical protein